MLCDHPWGFRTTPYSFNVIFSCLGEGGCVVGKGGYCRRGFILYSRGEWTEGRVVVGKGSSSWCTGRVVGGVF